MDKLERIDALLELNVLIGELGLIFNLTQLFLDQLLGTLRKRREARAIRIHDRQRSVSNVLQWSRTRFTGCFQKRGGRSAATGPLELAKGRYAHLKVLPNACTRSMIMRCERVTSRENGRKKGE